MTSQDAERETFGTAPDGSRVFRARLVGGGLCANILTWGASVQSLHLDGHSSSLVLGFDDFQSYVDHGLYFGATVGRFSNRIGNGFFEIDGSTFQTDQNFMGKHTLHGGREGAAAQNWQIVDLGTSHVDMTLTLEDGHMGFPGNATIICSYALKDNGTLAVTYVTRTDAPTLAGITHHSYFTLDDALDVRDTVFQIHADHYLPVNEEMIPTGAIEPVIGTPFDFNEPRTIAEDTDAAVIYDHNFCLADHRRNIQHVASATSARSQIRLDVSTTEPGLQFYAAHAMDIPIAGLNGATYDAFSGFCMETQNWPDAPNHAGFPNAILRPDEELRQSSSFQFSKM